MQRWTFSVAISTNLRFGEQAGLRNHAYEATHGVRVSSGFCGELDHMSMRSTRPTSLRRQADIMDTSVYHAGLPWGRPRRGARGHARRRRRWPCSLGRRRHPESPLLLGAEAGAPRGHVTCSPPHDLLLEAPRQDE